MPKEKPRQDKNRSEVYRKLNAILLIFIVISAAVLVFRYYNLIHPPGGGDGGNGGENNTTVVVRSIIPSHEAGIINGHEHIQGPEVVEKWLAAMDRVGVSTTVMVGSPDATFYLTPSGRFNKYKENNEDLLKLVESYPDRFIAFPTIYTYDDDKLELLKDYIARGAIGLKLFSGHYASFHDYLGPLNHTTMFPVYEYCQENRIPLIWHVHLGIDYIYDEFEDVLKHFPDLIINIPHFGLSSIVFSRLEYFLDTYPNLYTDVSFGYWAKSGLWRLSNYTAFYGEKLTKYQDRFTFGTDMVCTVHPRKDVEWIANLTQGYIDILEKDHFDLFVKEDIEGDFNGEAPGDFSGLNLSKEVLDKIYYDNMIKFLNGRNYTVSLSDAIAQSSFEYEDDDTRAAIDGEDYTDMESAWSELSLAVVGQKNNYYYA